MANPLAMNMDATVNNPTTSIDWNSVTATPWAMHHLHGVPILDTHTLTPEQQKYWENYNTTTYLTLDSPYQSYLFTHLSLLILSAFFIYPFVLVLNNLESGWFLPLLSAQTIISIISCLSYSIFINNVPDLYPNMSYSKMITGWFILTILQFAFAIVFSVKRWLYPNPEPMPSLIYDNQLTNLNHFSDSVPSNNKTESIPLNDFASPASTLFDDENADTDSFNLENTSNSSNNNSNSNLNLNGLGLSSTIEQSRTSPQSELTKSRNVILDSLSSSPFLTKLASSFGTLFTILHNLATWGMFIYFLILIPVGVACLNLFGKGQDIFNLLAHWIKGEIFVVLGLVSLARYCGCFAGIGGAWNFAYIDLESYKSIRTNSNLLLEDKINSGISGVGSGGSNVSISTWTKIHQSLISKDTINRFGGLICSFEFIESLLIFTYGASNVFLEHLASTDGVWTPKDLQHVSIAFMYFGAGLCGLIAEFKLSSWRRSLFFNITSKQLATIEKLQIDEQASTEDQHHILGSKKLISPGFSPNPFPVFTIFWTGILMSKHAQASQLATDIHIQWGTLLTYGSFFRVFTFLLMSYYPLRDSKECFAPGKPLTELITSFCLLCGGLVFMESTEQVIQALAYRGLTPMFTINVSVGVISLVMAWIMCIFAIKDKLRNKQLQNQLIS